MIELPRCPCCGEDALRVVPFNLENGCLHYRVECLACGVEMHHERFYGYNEVVTLMQGDWAAPACENISMTGSSDSWLCSKCGSRRKKQGAEKEYAFCPDCGAEVLEW